MSIPLLIVVISGVGLAFRSQFERLAGVESNRATEPTNLVLSAVHVSPAEAIELARSRYPGSELTAIVFPRANVPWFRIRLLTSKERPRIWGTTTVLISAAGGTVLKVADERTKSSGERAIYTLYPLHTGQFAGAVARVVALLAGLVLAGLFGAGLGSWMSKRTAAAGVVRRSPP